MTVRLLKLVARTAAVAAGLVLSSSLYAQSGAAGAGGAVATRPNLPLKHAPRPTTAAITADDLMSRVYVFADDSMQGREAGTAGHVRATEYIVRELTRLGLRPAGEGGTFYQNVPLVRSRLDLPAAVLRSSTRAFQGGADFQPVPGVFGLDFPLGANAPSAPIVFGGRLGSPDAIKGADVAGKIVVLQAPTGPNGQPAFQIWADPFDAQLQSYRGAAGVLVASLDITPPQLSRLLSEETMQIKRDPPASDKPPIVMVTRDVARQLIGVSLDSARVGAEAGTGALVWGFRHDEPPAPSRNVVAMVQGSDPALRGQAIVISAHSDHDGINDEAVDHDSLRVVSLVSRPMGAESQSRALSPAEAAQVRTMLDSIRALRPPRPDSIFNGADDDASGSMGLLEMAEYFQSLSVKPKRSIVFAWVAAEEKGLYGSEWFTDNPTIPRDSIIANVNIDMIGRGAAYDIADGGPQYLQILGSRRISTEYGDWVEEVNKRPEFGFRFDYQYDAPGHPQQYYCRSDHWNFARYSIPTVFFSTGSHVDYHMVTDEPQYINYPHLERVTRFVATFVEDVANRAGRPRIDKPVASPTAACVQ